MQIMLVFEIQIFVHQIQPVDFWFNISYSASIKSSKSFCLVFQSELKNSWIGIKFPKYF